MVDRTELSASGTPSGAFPAERGNRACGCAARHDRCVSTSFGRTAVAPNPGAERRKTLVRGAKCFLRHLWIAGVVAQPVKQPWPPLVQGFRDWLIRHRGVSETTLSRYSAAAVELLSTKELGDDPGQYDAERLRAFLIERSRRRGVGGTKAILSAVRIVSALSGHPGKMSIRLGRCSPVDCWMAFGVLASLSIRR